ncbi:unnamed protein product, partial [Allacma fusca]
MSPSKNGKPLSLGTTLLDSLTSSTSRRESVVTLPDGVDSTVTKSTAVSKPAFTSSVFSSQKPSSLVLDSQTRSFYKSTQQHVSSSEQRTGTTFASGITDFVTVVPEVTGSCTSVIPIEPTSVSAISQRPSDLTAPQMMLTRQTSDVRATVRMNPNGTGNVTPETTGNCTSIIPIEPTSVSSISQLPSELTAPQMTLTRQTTDVRATVRMVPEGTATFTSETTGNCTSIIPIEPTSFSSISQLPSELTVPQMTLTRPTTDAGSTLA